MSGLTYLDLSATVPDLEQAVALGSRYNQVAIYDLLRFEEIRIGGTGETPDDLPPPIDRLPPLHQNEGEQES